MFISLVAFESFARIVVFLMFAEKPVGTRNLSSNRSEISTRTSNAQHLINLEKQTPRDEQVRLVF